MAIHMSEFEKDGTVSHCMEKFVSKTCPLSENLKKKKKICLLLMRSEIIVCGSYICYSLFCSIFLLMSYCEQDLASLLDNMQKPFTEAQVGMPSLLY